MGIAASEEVLDLSELPAEMTAMVSEIFQGKPPVTGYSRYGFDGSLTMKVAVAPVNLDSPMGKVVLEELQLDVLRPTAGTTRSMPTCHCRGWMCRHRKWGLQWIR